MEQPGIRHVVESRSRGSSSVKPGSEHKAAVAYEQTMIGWWAPECSLTHAQLLAGSLDLWLKKGRQIRGIAGLEHGRRSRLTSPMGVDKKVLRFERGYGSTEAGKKLASVQADLASEPIRHNLVGILLAELCSITPGGIAMSRKSKWSTSRKGLFIDRPRDQL